MAMPFGVSFLPSGDASLKPQGEQGQPLQEAIKVLSMRVPKVLGAQSPVAPGILAGTGGPTQGGGGMQGGMLEALLRKFMAPEATTAAPTPPMMAPPTAPAAPMAPPAMPAGPMAAPMASPAAMPGLRQGPMAAGPRVSGAPGPLAPTPPSAPGPMLGGAPPAPSITLGPGGGTPPVEPPPPDILPPTAPGILGGGGTEDPGTQVENQLRRSLEMLMERAGGKLERR